MALGTKMSKWDVLSAALLTLIVAFLNIYDLDLADSNLAGNQLPGVSATEWKKIEFDFKDENITNRFCR